MALDTISRQVVNGGRKRRGFLSVDEERGKEC
jgi:hypothetical protein